MIRTALSLIAVGLLAVVLAAAGPLIQSITGQPADRAIAGGAGSETAGRAGPEGQQLAQSVRAADLIVMMTLTPGDTGESELSLMYFDSDGDERQTGSVHVRLAYLEYGDISVAWQPAEAHQGHVRLAGQLFPHEGRWRIEVEIERAGMDAARAGLEVGIRPARRE